MTSGEEEHLRREAAAWFARMRGPGAETARPDFNAWRAAPGRQDAYDRLVRRYEESAILGHSKLSDLRLRTSASRRAPPHAAWWAASAAVLVAAIALAIVSPWPIFPDDQPPLQRLAAGTGQIRSLSPAPGLTVVLDADTVLLASNERGRSRLVLERGRARIQAQGPVDVQAGALRVMGQDAAFDLRLSERTVEVSALSGSLEARRDRHPLISGRTRLQPGQALILADDRLGPPTRAAGRERQWPQGLRLYQDTSLAEVLTDANRYGARKIRLADPALGSLQVSGALKVTDPDGLARALAAALSLTVTQVPGGDLALSRRGA